MNVRIEYQETEKGERVMELWIGNERICTVNNVTRKKAITNMVEIVNSVNTLSRLQDPFLW